MTKEMQFLDKIKTILDSDEKVIAVLIFGSYARNQPNRDIDLCFVLDKKYSNKEMTNKGLKYSSLLSNKFDISIYQQLPIYIRKRVLKDGKIIYCKNEDLLYEIAFETIKEFDSYEKLYNMYLDKVKYG